MKWFYKFIYQWYDMVVKMLVCYLRLNRVRTRTLIREPSGVRVWFLLIKWCIKTFLILFSQLVYVLAYKTVLVTINYHLHIANSASQFVDTFYLFIPSLYSKDRCVHSLALARAYKLTGKRDDTKFSRK